MAIVIDTTINCTQQEIDSMKANINLIEADYISIIEGWENTWLKIKDLINVWKGSFDETIKTKCENIYSDFINLGCENSQNIMCAKVKIEFEKNYSEYKKDVGGDRCQICPILKYCVEKENTLYNIFQDIFVLMFRWWMNYEKNIEEIIIACQNAVDKKQYLIDFRTELNLPVSEVEGWQV